MQSVDSGRGTQETCYTYIFLNIYVLLWVKGNQLEYNYQFSKKKKKKQKEERNKNKKMK